MASRYTKPYSFQKNPIIQGWGGQFSPPGLISSYEYDLSTQILYTFYPQNQYDVFLNVPASIPQQLSIAGRQYSSLPSYPNPDTIYSTNIKGVFPQCILTENGSPLLCQNGDYLVL